MKKVLLSIGVVLLVLNLSISVWAGSYTFQPKDRSGYSRSDLWDLDHGKAYTWGMGLQLQENEEIVSASISFDNIRNWTTEDNDLWFHLLDNIDPWAKQIPDSQAGAVDYFAGQGIELHHWEDLPATAQDLTYTFDADELNVLASYISNDPTGIFGFGFDPDCHFYNDGITFTIDTATEVTAVPEPTTLLLIGVGLLGLIGFKRSAKK